jgi:acetyl esterase/lipase
MSTVAAQFVWNGMTQAALDAAYNNMAAVSDSTERVASWTARSAELRSRQAAELDIAYGPKPRNRFDVFRCGRPDAPLVVFIHGGWWQRNSKEVFSCVAEGPLALGLDVALIGYTLAPEATLSEIAREVRGALDALVSYQAAHGRPTEIILSGWSAGGHLTVLAMDHPAVAAGLSISGVFDLEPIRHSYINDKLRLTETEVTELSPQHRQLTSKPLIVAFGRAELPEMQRQSVEFHACGSIAGSPVENLPLVGRDHFSIIEDLIRPEGELAKACRRLAPHNSAD